MQMDERSETHQVKVMQCTNQHNANLDFTLNPRATGSKKNNDLIISSSSAPILKKGEIPNVLRRIRALNRYTLFSDSKMVTKFDNANLKKNPKKLKKKTKHQNI